MVTQNHFVIPATVLEKFRSRGFPEGVTVTAYHCIYFIVCPDEISQNRLLKFRASGTSLTKIEDKQTQIAPNFST